MKKQLILFFCSLFLLSNIIAQDGDGIEFLESEFGEILALAELEGKLVFVDAYTDWCLPCKKMDKDVFSQKEVGDFYNNNFLSIKINMEQGEGLTLAEKYLIFAYPSLLFVDYDGTVVHRYAGYKDDKGMLALGKEALDDSNNLEGLAEQYNSGERSPEFLMQYLQASFQAADGGHVEILEAYLATQSDWNTPDNKELIYNLLDRPDSKLFDHLVKNKAEYIKVYGENEVATKIQGMVYESLSKGTTKLENADKLFARAFPKEAKKLAAQYKMAYYQQKEDGGNYAQAAINYVKSFPEINSEELNDISWMFYDIVDNKKQLKQALKWAKKSVKKDNSFLNNDTLAALYYKYGKNKKALKIANKAIVIAKANNEDYSSSAQLIQEISNEN